MRTLEFRTVKVLEQDGISSFSTSPDAEADLRIVMTRDEAQELVVELIKLYDPRKEFTFFTLRGAGRGVRS